MESVPLKIRNELEEFRASQEKQLLRYQAEKNNEMAYLVRWSILEKLVKTLATEYRRRILIVSLREWLNHIENGGPKPAKNPNTSVESKVLPKKEEFIACLNYFGLNGQDVWTIMDSKGRHRRHRNELAHTGKKFVNYLLYITLLSDLEKITEKIFEELKSNKANTADGKKRRR